MKSFGRFWVVLIFLLALGVWGEAQAEDVVYLKDGSIIHGTITEEVPGKSIKIETKDGNVFVYKMKAIQKITHSAVTSGSADGDASSNMLGAPKKAFAPVVDHNAKFNKFGFLLNCGFWAPGGTKQMNDNLEAAAGGDTSYDYLPGWVKAGLGIGWFTNNLGLKWNFQGTIEPNDYTYSVGTYYGSYTGTVDTYFLYAGTELEADLGIDSVTNKDNVFTAYLPLIVGVWDEEYSVTAGSYTNTFTGACTDFGTGIGVRGFDTSNFLWDCQLVYRFSNGSYLKDASGNQIPYVNGSYLFADVAGLDLNFTFGFLFQ